jgi:hypothetical protein
MGFVNVIWQGDANGMALQSLAHAAQPPTILNLAGESQLSVRAAAHELATVMRRQPCFTGAEAPDALLSDGSRARALFGPPSIDTATLIEWTARWIAAGGSTLGKPTRFQSRDGSF